MSVTIDIPEAVAKRFGLDRPDAGRRALESLLLAAYQRGELSSRKLGEYLGLTFDEAEEFLQRNGAPPQLTAEELQAQHEFLKKLIEP